MIDIRQLEREHDELLKKRQDIYDKAIAEKRGITEEEKAEDQKLEKQANDMAQMIDKMKEIECQRAGIPKNQPQIGHRLMIRTRRAQMSRNGLADSASSCRQLPGPIRRADR